MDHAPAGLPKNIKRLQRWPSIIQVGDTSEQYITYTGTPPNNQRFKLITDSDKGTIVTIKYPKTGVYKIKIGDNKIAPNTWDNAKK